jgi:NADH dehydrogenase
VPVQLTLVDRRNFHLFQPLLYQVATGGLSPANISAPLRDILKHQKNTEVIMSEVCGVDSAARKVKFADGGALDYDTLVLAPGSAHHYFGHDEWEPLAPPLKTIEDATTIRSRVLRAFEAAEREENPERIRALLTFIIVGGGPTGVEMAGAMSEIARHTLKGNFRRIDPATSSIHLIEAADRVLPNSVPELSEKAAKSLGKLGIIVRTRTQLTSIEPEKITLRFEGKDETIATHNVIWAAGMRASSLGKIVADATGCELDKSGRIVVEPDLTIRGHPEIFVIGDLAQCKDQNGKPLPGLAPVAMQEGRYAARLIAARLKGKSFPAFHYHDKGTMATIGRSSAVVDLGWIRFGGWLAWVTWLFVHLMYIVQFHNKLLILLQWAWNYFTRNRSARLITQEQSTKRDR